MLSEPSIRLQYTALARAVAIHVGLVLATLVAGELFLRAIDIRQLRLTPQAQRLPFQHDAELGWVPIADQATGDGTRINSLGLRDIEPAPSSGSTILFIGDSLVYGSGVSAEQRFTDRLRQELPAFRIVNAGVAGYGTDQEYLLLKRLMSQLAPSVVVLIVCVDNDRADNSSNARYQSRKPYLANVDGEWKFQGIPVPHGYGWYYNNNWLAARSALVRLALVGYTDLRYPRVIVPDPTAQLIGLMRDYVESRAAKFLVGLQRHDRELELSLAAMHISHVRFDNAETIPGDIHWNAQGHLAVAQQLVSFFRAEDVIKTTMRAP